MLAFAGALLAGYAVAFVLGGQSQRNAAIVSMAMEASDRPSAAASSDAVVVPAPKFEVLGAPPEPLRAPAVAAASDAPPAPSLAPTVPATVSPSTAALPAVAAAAPTAAVPTASAAAPPALAPPSTPPTSPSAPAAASPRPAASPAAGRSNPPTATSTATFVREGFDSVASGWPVRPLADWSAEYVDGRYVVRVVREQPIGIAYPLARGNYRMAVDVAAEAGAGGLVFLYAEPASFLWAGIAADGSFGVERVDGEASTTLVPWQPLARPAGNNETIRLEIRRRGRGLTVWAAGRQVAAFETPPGTWENRYGFVVAPRNGKAVAAFDNLHGERLP